jgi:hypothetical protein
MPSRDLAKASDRLPTSWDLYNLSASPYFHTPLEATESSPHPLSLFVGREPELATLLDNIASAGRASSRQAIAGVPGVGKTTLVKELKARLHQAGYLTTDTVVPVLADDDLPLLFGRILSALYDTIVANRPYASGNRALEAAETLVRSARIPTGGGGFSVLGIGASATKGTTVLGPKDVRLEGPKVAYDLAQFVLGTDARGVVLHLNNLENLTEKDAVHAADLLRDLRDMLLTHHGLHFIVTGTPDAVTTAIDTHPQVRSHFEVLQLEPLTVTEVHELLRRRYEHLRLEPKRAPVPPVENAVVAHLHGLYRGDLRGLLQALETGVKPLLTLNAADGTPRPATVEAVRATLQERYAREISRKLDPVRAKQLTKWGETDPAASMTQAKLQTLWGLKSQGSTSTAINALVAAGYALALPREGKKAVQYVLTGVSRLIYG